MSKLCSLTIWHRAVFFMEYEMINQERLKQLLNYDPDTGVFTWLFSRRGVKTGSIAGTVHPSGYIVIRIDGRLYRAHRLAFLYMKSTFPAKDADHINGIKADNRWINLREATRSENKRNSGKHADNTSGYKGVYKRKATGKWVARCQVHGKKHCLGDHDTPELAHAAYCKFASEHHREFFNPGS